MTNIRIEPTNKVLSSFGGLVLFEKMVEKLKLDAHISEFLPRGKKSSAENSYAKFYQILMGFLAGAVCLDDLDYLRTDKIMRAVHERMYASNTEGEFLRSFSEAQVKELNHRLIELSLRLRTNVHHKKEKRFILDLDTTDHEQHGVKIEGVKENRTGLWGLNSIQAYDNYGFQYWFDLRPGATHTSVGSVEIISTVFRYAKKFYFKNDSKHFILRADSGYCNLDVFRACFTAGIKFVVCMRSDMYENILDTQDIHWKSTKLKTRDKRAFEIGEAIYRSKELNEVVRVVLLRAKRTDTMFEEYDVYGWATNLCTSSFCPTFPRIAGLR